MSSRCTVWMCRTMVCVIWAITLGIGVALIGLTGLRRLIRRLLPALVGGSLLAALVRWTG